MRMLRTEKDVIEFVESLDPDEANEILKQMVVNCEIGGFAVDRNENGKWIVDLVPKSNRQM